VKLRALYPIASRNSVICRGSCLIPHCWNQDLWHEHVLEKWVFEQWSTHTSCVFSHINAASAWSKPVVDCQILEWSCMIFLLPSLNLIRHGYMVYVWQLANVLFIIYWGVIFKFGEQLVGDECQEMVNQDENQMLHSRCEWNVWPLWSIYANTLAPHPETEWWELLELHPMVVCWLVGHWPISYLTDKGYTCHWLVSTRGASEHYSDVSNHISSSNISLAARVILGSVFI